MVNWGETVEPGDLGVVNVHEEHQAAGEAFLGDKADLMFRPTDDDINAWIAKHR